MDHLFIYVYSVDLGHGVHVAATTDFAEALPGDLVILEQGQVGCVSHRMCLEQWSGDFFFLYSLVPVWKIRRIYRHIPAREECYAG